VLQRARAIGAGRAEHEPFEVHVIELPSAAALDAYLNDDRRVALDEARDHAIARTELLRVALV
jgi:hypothetical protein